MAKSSAAEAIMPPDKMKPLLALSKSEPVHAAMCLSGDGDGVLLLDKKAKPKRVLAMLKANAVKAKLPPRPENRDLAQLIRREKQAYREAWYANDDPAKVNPARFFDELRRQSAD